MRMNNLIRSLQSKIFFCTFLSVVMSVSLGMGLLYRQAADIIKRQAIAYATADIEVINTNLSQVFDDARNVALKVAINDDVITTCKTTLRPASYNEFNQYKQMNSFLKNLIANDPMVDEVVLYRIDGTNFHSGPTFIPQNIHWNTDDDSELHGITVEHDENGNIVIYIIREVTYMKQTIGMIQVKINQKQLFSLYEKTTIPETALFSFDVKGNLLYGNEKALVLQKEDAVSIKQFNNFDGSKVVKIRGDRMFVLSKTYGFYDIKTLSLIPYEVLIKESIRIRRLVLLITVICTVLSFGLSWFFSIYICKDLGKLRLTMLRIRQGNLHVPVERQYRTQEVSDLAEIFDAMMHSINDLMEKNLEMEKKRKIVEQDYLRLQIQPHFIYGTINSMQYLAHLHGEIEIEQVASALVELLRVVLGNGEQFVPISQEQYYVEQYLVIQRCKFRKPFIVNWNISPELLSHPIPKLILQPIVENALVHGIADLKNGVIDIIVNKDNGKIIFTIKDNGVGISNMEPVVIHKGYAFGSIGLKNVFDRMQLLFGDEGNASIISSPMIGTTVTLVMPI